MVQKTNFKDHSTYLKPFPDGFQQVRYQRVVPQVSEPNPRAFDIHGTRKEETGACRDKRAQTMRVSWMEEGKTKDTELTNNMHANLSNTQ